MKQVVCKICHNKYAEEDHNFHELRDFAAFVVTVIAPQHTVTHGAYYQMFLIWKQRYHDVKTNTK